jgi:acylphosphatase
MKHWNIKVTGKVQGVFFRASTKAVADQLGVKGFVKNLSDGSVYIEAAGDHRERRSTLISAEKNSQRDFALAA